MLTKEENEIVSRVGPGTLMGNLMREYWLPAMLSAEVAADSDPVRVLLLGEKLIAFRDTNGRVGLIQNHCPHRGASLFFGRNEEAGLRCVYHGWKFDVSGQCVDMPNEPAESNFKNKVKAVAYPTQERRGVVWVYMGPRSVPPPMPDLEANVLPDSKVTVIQRENSWLQSLEGDIDTVHSALLHSGSIAAEDVPKGTFAHFVVKHRSPRYESLDSAAGATYAAYCEADPGFQYWRIGHFFFPCFTSSVPGLLGWDRRGAAWVPMDDEHTINFFFSAPRPGLDVPLPGSDEAKPRHVGGIDGLQPNTTDWLGRFRPAACAANDYLIDREVQRRNQGPNGYSGIPGVLQQDSGLQGAGSMGAIQDRTTERLGTSDVMIIRVRRRLIAAARALAEHGVTPPGVDEPEGYRLRSGGVFLREGTNWSEATRELQKAYVEHPELDTSLSLSNYQRNLGRQRKDVNFRWEA